MKLTDYKNEEAVDILADILEPCVQIFGDAELKKASEEGKPQIKIISLALKRHKKEIVEILARLEGKDVEEYECNIITIPAKLIELLNDKELIPFFQSFSRKMEQTSSGSAMESTEGSEQ